MILVNVFVFTKYRNSKFDKPYLFVVLAYTFNYFVETVLSLIYLGKVEDGYDIDRFKATTLMFKNLSESAVFALLFLFANELHRVK